MVAWPTTLPQEAFVGLTEQRQDARLRTQMDKGPPKMRRRFTAAVRRVTVPLVLSGAEKQAFDTFYITTLQEGSLPFDWRDPVTDATISFRFAESPPQWSVMAGGVPNSRLWSGTLDLEILP